MPCKVIKYIQRKKDKEKSLLPAGNGRSPATTGGIGGSGGDVEAVAISTS
jgi:hypothetical protein